MTKKRLAMSISLAGVGVTSAALITLIFVKQNHSNYKRRFNFVNNSNYLSDDTINLVDQKLSKNLKYQQYNHLLNGIKFVDSGYASTTPNNINFEAGYIWDTDEIIFNTSELKKLNFLSHNDQAEYIYELLFHEYNHFLNNHFIANVMPSDSIHYLVTTKNSTTPIWNKNFVDEFKHELNYDQNTPLYQGRNLPNLLAAKYSVKDLYNFANNSKSSLSFADKKILGSGSSDSRHNTKLREVDEDTIKYMFSLDELIARKMQIVNMPYLAAGAFKKDGWININNFWRPSPYLEDILSYQDNLEGSNQFFADKPTAELSEIYNKYVNPLQDITYLEFKNNQFVENDGKVSGQYEKSKITFGGSIDDNSVKVGYIENNKFIQLPITTNGKNYHLKEYIELNKVLNKPLVKMINGNKEPLSIGEQNSKVISTYKYWDKDKINYKIVTKNGHTVIEKIS